MGNFNELYNDIIKSGVNGTLKETLDDNKHKYDKHQLECLLNPEDQPPVIRIGDCDCGEEGKLKCVEGCFFDAIEDNGDNISISKDKCVGCGDCIANCIKNNLTDRKDLYPVLNLLQSQQPVYAMIAPAFIGQLGKEATAGRLRTAFKKLGFAGMVEVALFADILTLKEALEFDRHIKDDNDFVLTSCCCPIWIAMIRRVYSKYITHVPPSVSPMVACGRAIKLLYPDAKTVFIGPCVAKKAEAKEEDIKDAVDYVLNFQEMSEIFKAAEINIADLPEDNREHSSTGGRIYARTGGVSDAVKSTVERLRPDRKIKLKATQVDGVVSCKAMLENIKNGKIDANFIEGMGCVGGCVGGPKVVIDKEKARTLVNEYGSESLYETPADNPFVIELLGRLGFDSVESLLEKDRIFTRDFGAKD